MDNLERLAGSIAQIEILVASLKRENRDLAARLAQVSAERRQFEQAAESRLRQAQAQQADREGADLARQLEEARRGHAEEKARLEGLLRRLEAQVLAPREHEQLPTASPEALEALGREKEALEGRAARLELDLGILRGHLEQAQEREAQAVQAAEALRARQGELEKRVTALESSGLDLERRLGEANLKLSQSPDPADAAQWQARLKELEALSLQAERLEEQALRLEAEKAGLKRQKRELAAFAKERALLRRKTEELVATLESVRLG